MNLLRKLGRNSINSQIVFAFFTLTILIISLEILAYAWTRQMLDINSLKEISSQLKENQLQMKSASNEFILREKTNEQFFASSKSIFLDRYFLFFNQLQKISDEIQANTISLSGIDQTELTDLKFAIKSYHDEFLQMTEKIKMRGYGRYGLIGEFDKSIKTLLQYDFGTDNMAVLHLQLFVKNYLLTGDENISSNISDEIYLFTLALEKHVKDEEVEKVAGILFRYETVFKELVNVDHALGIYTGEGLQSRLFASSDNLDKAVRLEKINAGIKEAYSTILVKLYLSFFLIVGAAVVAAFSINKKLFKTLVVPIHQMKSVISRMSLGEVPKSNLNFKIGDLNEMANAINNLVTGTRNYQSFANDIGKGNLDTTFTPLSDQDILGISLLAMRENLKINISEQYEQMLELQRVNAELDSFTYHASHDLRAPLTSIQGLVYLGLKESSIEISHSYLRMIQDRVNHMDTLLKDLISMSYNNKSEINNEVFDFESEVNSLLRSLEYPGRKFDIQLDIRQNYSFRCDPVRVRTILGNLISNAFKYYNPDAQKHYINLQVCVDSKHAEIKIKDNGIGIDQAYKEKIYNMFFRATTRSTGTGLGLYIVKSMVDRLKGQINFESTLNEGTTFQVIIPNHVGILSPKELEVVHSDLRARESYSCN